MEKLEIEKQKIIIDKIVRELTKEDIDLYYTDSSTVSHLVYEKINNNFLNKTDYEFVKELSANDILILMSYNSNCC